MAIITETHNDARHEIVTNRTQRTIALVIYVGNVESCRYTFGETVCAGLETELAEARKSLPPKPPEDPR